MLFGVNTLGAPRDIVVLGGQEPPQSGGGELEKILPIMDSLGLWALKKKVQK